MILFMYPIVMSIIWIVFSLIFEGVQKTRDYDERTFPMVSILIPCFNEELHIQKTVTKLVEIIDYPEYEVILINDGSTDNTFPLLMTLSGSFRHIRICNSQKNFGKAHALIQGTCMSKGEFLLCIDADATVEPKSIRYLVRHFIGKTNHMVGAVTGNPFVKNRGTFLTKIQSIEFLSIIGLIKRAQMAFGTINTVSGVCVMYRKSAVIDSGWWDQTCVTEDIAMTWRLQRNKWEIRFEPKAICWMLAPEKARLLFVQRLRWAQGGMDVLLKNRTIFSWKHIHFGLCILYLDQVCSIIWSIFWYSYLPILFSKLIIFQEISVTILAAVLLVILLSFIQFIVSLAFNLPYDPSLLRLFVFSVWYILFYWVVNPLTILLSIPIALRDYELEQQATWISPDRGND